MIVQEANGQVLVSWDLVPGATQYKVQRSTDGVTFAIVSTAAPIQFLDTTVTVGVEYYYKVCANNVDGDSPYTNPQTIIPAYSGKMALGVLRYRAQQRADRLYSQFVTKEEWNSYINQSYFELYDLLVQKYGNEYFVAEPANFTTTGAQFYTLPNGSTSFLRQDGSSFVAKPFFKLLGVDLALNTASKAYITLKKFEFISRNRYVYPQITTNLLGVAGMKYRMMGDQIEFITAPSGGQTIQLWYIPRMTELLKDTDMCDGVSGWTEYIIVDAAIKALQKEESDVTVLAAQKQALIDRIEAAAENRDAGEPELISNTRRYTDMYGAGNPGGDGPFGGF